MSSKDQELEVKFYIADLAALERRLQECGARLVQPRVHEVNLRFDTADSRLKNAAQVLRLRKDTAARMTFKGPSQVQQGVRVRQEIEFTVGDFEAARSFLQALGYDVAMMYEKYRTTYEREGVLVVLDELPYGSFAEIEGPDPESILALNALLGLNWEARAPESYTALFDRLCAQKGYSFRDLSFENFKELPVSAEDFGLTPADIR